MRKYYTIKYYSVESSAPYHWESLVCASPGPRHRSVPFDNPPTSPAKSIGHANGLFQRSHRSIAHPPVVNRTVPPFPTVEADVREEIGEVERMAHQPIRSRLSQATQGRANAEPPAKGEETRQTQPRRDHHQELPKLGPGKGARH